MVSIMGRVKIVGVSCVGSVILTVSLKVVGFCFLSITCSFKEYMAWGGECK